MPSLATAKAVVTLQPLAPHARLTIPVHFCPAQRRRTKSLGKRPGVIGRKRPSLASFFQSLGLSRQAPRGQAAPASFSSR